MEILRRKWKEKKVITIFNSILIHWQSVFHYVFKCKTVNTYISMNVHVIYIHITTCDMYGIDFLVYIWTQLYMVHYMYNSSYIHVCLSSQSCNVIAALICIKRWYMWLHRNWYTSTDHKTTIKVCPFFAILQTDINCLDHQFISINRSD